MGLWSTDFLDSYRSFQSALCADAPFQSFTHISVLLIGCSVPITLCRPIVVSPAEIHRPLAQYSLPPSYLSFLTPYHRSQTQARNLPSQHALFFPSSALSRVSIFPRLSLWSTLHDLMPFMCDWFMQCISIAKSWGCCFGALEGRGGGRGWRGLVGIFRLLRKV